jgi:hypothetical protein
MQTASQQHAACSVRLPSANDNTYNKAPCQTQARGFFYVVHVTFFAGSAMYAVNIIARSLVALVGLFIALGEISVGTLGSPFQETFGIVVFLFGALRVAQFITRSRNEDAE